MMTEHGRKAVAVTDQATYSPASSITARLPGCQDYFIDEAIDVSLVTYLKPAAAA